MQEINRSLLSKRRNIAGTTERTGGCSRLRNAARGTELAVLGSRYALPARHWPHLQQDRLFCISFHI
jgi:hypothetical protein